MLLPLAIISVIAFLRVGQISGEVNTASEALNNANGQAGRRPPRGRLRKVLSARLGKVAVRAALQIS